MFSSAAVWLAQVCLPSSRRVYFPVRVLTLPPYQTLCLSLPPSFPRHVSASLRPPSLCERGFAEGGEKTEQAEAEGAGSGRNVGIGARAGGKEGRREGRREKIGAARRAGARARLKREHRRLRRARSRLLRGCSARAPGRMGWPGGFPCCCPAPPRPRPAGRPPQVSGRAALGGRTAA